MSDFDAIPSRHQTKGARHARECGRAQRAYGDVLAMVPALTVSDGGTYNVN